MFILSAGVILSHLQKSHLTIKATKLDQKSHPMLKVCHPILKVYNACKKCGWSVRKVCSASPEKATWPKKPPNLTKKVTPYLKFATPFLKFTVHAKSLDGVCVKYAQLTQRKPLDQKATKLDQKSHPILKVCHTILKLYNAWEKFGWNVRKVCSASPEKATWPKKPNFKYGVANFKHRVAFLVKSGGFFGQMAFSGVAENSDFATAGAIYK